MICTTRFAHLAEDPPVKIGDKIKKGQKIGTMGKTGFSHGVHLHLDSVKGSRSDVYTLNDMNGGNPEPWPEQLNHFIDRDLFKAPFKVTTPYADYDYQVKLKKVHHAYDVISLSGDWSIFWNRTADGTVTRVSYLPESYGWIVYIEHEVL